MNTLQKQITFTMGLGVLSLLAGLFTHMALTDIYHDEADVTLEWRVVQVSALVILAFIILALVTLGRAFRHVR